MSETKKRYFASVIRTNKEVDGFFDFCSHIYPSDANGNIDPDSKIESTEMWLASHDDLERLHDLLCQVLNKPRG
ncbi:hypothetical protein V9948_004503 [Providencia rettgeri]|nr:hypothetical protein [Providencia rettgeri]